MRQPCAIVQGREATSYRTSHWRPRWSATHLIQVTFNRQSIFFVYMFVDTIGKLQ